MKPSMMAMNSAKEQFLGGPPAPDMGADMGGEMMEDGMEPGNPNYDVLSEAAKRVFEQYLQAGEVPEPEELVTEGLSPREADDVAELLEDTLGVEEV